MALVSDTLETALRQVLRTKPREVSVAARGLAEAYRTYTLTAQAGAALPLFLGTEVQGLETLLKNAMRAESGTAVAAAQAWGSGISSFWLSSVAPVVFSDGVNVGPVPAVPGVPALVSALTALFSNGRVSEVAAARGLAQALDAATRTIVVLLQPSNVLTPVI